MERKHKITIPEPCHENWDKMTPKDNGRFCLSCSKTVIDFTTMLPEEVQHFFIQNQNKNICGRFKKSQLDTITIQIPSRILYSQTNYHKMFLLALFIAMGTTLFSCQDKNGSKQKIDKVEVVKGNALEKNITKGKALRGENEIPPPPKVDQVKFVKGEPKNKKIKFHKPVPIRCGEVTKDNNTEEEIYSGLTAIEVVPDFPGGIDNFYQLFIKEFKRPEETENLKNRIIVSFVIEKDGSLSTFDFSENTDPKIKTEITRALKTLPNWVPGTQNGKKTRTKYSMPIAFEKDSSENSK
ncbi:hypothetical protein [uncultured Flavobacterium sp.]|uniref:hypothetical protein n=1 Tax=uncultured Flavobacterium sp. TaxID=165435 RepID=UPI00292F2B0C|nr:hypothetical protein [uncultured Flavobacterium sp.]